MSIGICSIAFGKEHVDECKNLIKQVSSDFYVLTDDDTLIADNVIVDKTTFNFNKKRIPISEAFKKHDIVICLDTDVNFKVNINEDLFNDIEDGLYVKWMGGIELIKEHKLSITQILKSKTPFEDINEYGKSLIQCGANESNICFFDEYMFVLKISNQDTKDRFITNWESIYNKTIDSQPKDRHGDNLNGAIESLIISLACYLSEIKLYFNELHPLFNGVIHYSSVPYTKTLL
jgi:hypothetical protein